MSCAALTFPLASPGVPLIPPNNNKLPLFNFAGASTRNPHRRLHGHRRRDRRWRSSASPDESDGSFIHQAPDFNNAGEPSLHVDKSIWMKWKEKSSEMSRKAAKLGLSAVLAYGLFDAFTYTTFFVLAFLGYEKSTGKNPAANLQALLGIVIFMWTGNNVTRPFRVAGAAALAPFIDRGLRRIQRLLNFPSVASAFGLVVGIVAAVCLTVVGLLVLSRWGK